MFFDHCEMTVDRIDVVRSDPEHLKALSPEEIWAASERQGATLLWVDQTVEHLAVRPPFGIVSTQHDQGGPFDQKAAHLTEVVSIDLAEAGWRQLPLDHQGQGRRTGPVGPYDLGDGVALAPQPCLGDAGWPGSRRQSESRSTL